MLFGIGLIISQMTNPAKVIGFLDILDGWDPSLIFVMISGLLVFALGYWMLKGQIKTPLGITIDRPTRGQIDRPLIMGSATFGLGWGLVGLCPGPALAALLIGGQPIMIFVAAMLAGMGLHRLAKPYISA